jgi:hypothetical protein
MNYRIYKGTTMNKFTCSILAAALSLSAYSVSAATTTQNTDDGSAIGTSETPQIKQQDQTIESAPSKKTMPHKKTMHKKSHKMNSDMPDSSNANSMNNKPIGTTNGVSNNGSTDDTKVGEPINGIGTGTNNDSTKSAPMGY